MPPIHGRTVLITGGADGLGAATARRLVGRGASVSIVDLIGCWRTARAALPELRMARGYLLFVSSAAAVIQTPYQGAYQVSKAGLGALANTLRIEERRHGVAVGLALLGAIDTEPARRSMADTLMQEVLRKVPAALQKRRPVEEAATTLEEMIVGRTRQRVIPSSERLVFLAPGLAQRLSDRSM